MQDGAASSGNKQGTASTSGTDLTHELLDSFTSEAFRRARLKFEKKDYLFRNVFGEGTAAVIVAALKFAEASAGPFGGGLSSEQYIRKMRDEEWLRD